MQQQLDFGLARTTDPSTSRAAARRNRHALTDAIHAAFGHAGPDGLTDDELVRWLYAHGFEHVPAPTIKTARSRLTWRPNNRHGVLHPTRERRPSNTGSPMIVFVHQRFDPEQEHTTP